MLYSIAGGLARLGLSLRIRIELRRISSDVRLDETKVAFLNFATDYSVCGGNLIFDITWAKNALFR